MITTTHRFKIEDRIFANEEVLTVQQLTSFNGHPAYYVKEQAGMVFDNDCSNTNFLKVWTDLQNA